MIWALPRIYGAGCFAYTALGFNRRPVSAAPPNARMDGKFELLCFTIASGFACGVHATRVHQRGGNTFLYQANAIHSTDIKIPPGKGITCGALRAGGFSGKNSL